MADSRPLEHVQFAIPFDRIDPAALGSTFAELLTRARAAVASVAAQAEPLTYANTLAVLDHATEDLDHAFGVVTHLESVATTPALRAAYNEIQPLVSEFYANIPLDPALWSVLKRYASTPEATQLDPTRARHLKKTIDGFRRHGAELPTADKQRLAQIDVALSRATTTFSEHVLDSTNAFELVITEETKLAGLPRSAIDAAKENAAARDQQGFRFTLHAPSYVPLMTYLDDAAIRRYVWHAYNTRASEGPHDNRTLLAEIIGLRAQRATLLGYRNFADLVLEDRMAKTSEQARAFIEQLHAKTRPHFERENAELLAFRRQLEGSSAPPCMPWDVAYYAEKQRKALYDFDDEALRPYFPLEAALAGVFDVAGRLFGVRVQPRDDLPTWDPAVRCYRMVDGDGTELGSFYVDVFPRDNKRGGAWMNGLITGVPGEGRATPHLGLVCANMNPPTAGLPSLLTHNEVETLFHEFGHLFHHLLSNVEVRSLAGTNVAWDFVELPSQIMENWCWEREALDLFARHHASGAPIPHELFTRMHRARTYRAANAMIRQLGFAAMDLALHVDYTPRRDGDVVAFARKVMQPYAPAPLPDDYAMITGFGHLFSDPVGYAAGYYSYKWAEVLDADAFGRFKQAGVFSAEVGRSFRETILARGDSRDPSELFRAFVGRDPALEPLLERSGLLTGT